GYPDVSGNPIAYDANGSMKDQKDKGITNMAYNILNLPKTITYSHSYIVKNILFPGDEGELKNVTSSYFYRADGTKLKKTYVQGNKGGTERTTTTEYIDGFHYESNSNMQVLQFVPTSEGY